MTSFDGVTIHRVKAPNDLNECNTYERLRVCDDLTREMHDKKQNNKKKQKNYTPL